jgi:peptide/nickel transport system permease protein
VKRESLRSLIFSRVLQFVLVLLGVATVLFFILRLSGDPVAVMVGADAPEDIRQEMHKALGLDDPLLVQYGRFVSDVSRLDFGRSMRSGQSAMAMALSRVPATLLLSAATVVFIIVVGIPIGMYSALHRRSILGIISMASTLTAQAMPSFWLGLVLILVFAVQLRWVPSFGYGSWNQLILPAVTLGSFFAAKIARLVRSGILEVIGQDYIRTARAKGLHPRVVLWKHVFRNSLLSVVTVMFLDLSQLVGGAVVTETVFAWPGVGRLLAISVLSRDYPVVQASVFIIAGLVVVINLLADLLYRVIDPRIASVR